MNFRAVLALPKTAGSALTHKSISFIELFGALYMYISGYNLKMTSKDLLSLYITTVSNCYSKIQYKFEFNQLDGSI